MASTFTFELVTPERLLLSAPAEQVVVPGSEGDFAVLAGHAPVISTLRPGVIEITLPQGRQRIFVKKGVAEADPERLTVLAQTAVAVDDLDAERLSAEQKAAEAELAAAKDDQSKRMAEMLVDVLKRLQAKTA
ncbi:MAG TPA: F0F1 ATP synthase subunit epsilon [Hyphomicrobium sp.]|jgi:F-type H+-transporting ATPase subunit epsilon|nr:F0F1 ATP synthase subunit epsilon [Hyphomicrobium sp.]